MQSLAARRLAEGEEPQGFEPRAHLQRGGDHGGEGHLRRGVQIEDKSPGDVRLVRLAIPGMNLDSRRLGYGGKPFGTINLKVRLVIARDSDQVDHKTQPP